jgi:ribosomal protein S18 acetylase RimI-like enzyme
MAQRKRFRIETSDIPASVVPGLEYRRLDAPADYRRMNEIANAVRIAQHDTFFTNDAQFQQYYEHIERCDLTRDLFLAELDGRLIAYVRVGWHDEPETRVYEPIVFLDPAVPAQPIFDALFDLAEHRLAEIAETHGPGPKVARTNVTDAAPVLEAAIRARGYQPVRHFYAMVRPTLDEQLDAPMPAGLEIRDVRPEDMEAIYEAEVEAFRDHWGFAEPGATERDRFFNDPVESDVSLWRVAWDGPQVAGMVRSYIHPEQNERLGQKRGWVENISVRRPWRRRGLARALIAASFPLLRERGMTEAALGVDTQNESGAVGIYERCGFRVVSRSSEFSRTLETQ